MPICFTISADTAEEFAAEWTRVIPLLTSGGFSPDVVTGADDQPVDAPKPLGGEVIPPSKPRGRQPRKPPVTIEGTVETVSTPAPETAAKVETDAAPAETEAKPSADDVRAAFNALMKASPKREEAVYDILKEFKVKNATEVAAQDAAIVRNVIQRCKEKAEEDKAAAAVA